MNKLLTKNKHALFSIIFIFILFIGYNYKLFFNISTALSDWLDYPLIVYIQQQNIQHISTLDFTHFGDISMYHHTPDGMYFTDLLLPQSLIALFIYPFVQSYITTHNIVFFIVGLLNIISVYYFWSKIFKDKKILFMLSLLFTFSPYVFSMYAHYQMISYCFFFFSLGKLLDAKNNKDFIISGILGGLQFLAAVYIGIYSITISAIYFIWKLYTKATNSNKLSFSALKKLQYKNIFSKETKVITLQGLAYLFGFTIIAGYFVFKFAQTQKVYNITRPAEEYVNHSMQITDFFFNPLPSIWVESFYKKINVHNHRLGGETFGPGFILMSISILGFFKLRKKKLTQKEQYVNGFMILLFIWGFIAILGPRLSINGKYLATPLPYIFPLKLTPIFDALRVVSRWFLLVQIGLLYFVGFSLESIFKKYNFKKAIIIIALILFFYAIEIVPIKQRTEIQTYTSYGYEHLIQSCKSSDVLVEYPFAPEQFEPNAEQWLSYWAKMLLNLTLHNCNLVNGYSGFQPQHINEFVHNFRTSIETQDLEKIKDTLSQKDVVYIKFNKKMMFPENIKKVESIFIEPNYKIILNDSQYLLVMVN